MGKSLQDYAHLDIDQMNGHQLFEYSGAVIDAAVQILNIVGSHSMPRRDLIRILEVGALGPSEIAFGLTMSNKCNVMEEIWVDNVRTIRLLKTNE